MPPLISRQSAALTGTARVPGDKSISHRALMVGAVAIGETPIEGLLEGEDVLRTAAAMAELGAEVERQGAGRWRVRGRGLGGLVEPSCVLDMGNSGTATRLLLGLVASHPLTAFFTGDASLRRRPMARVTEPLSSIGARFVTRAGGRLPLAVVGAADPLPVTFETSLGSAQVKSAMILAGLNAPGRSTVTETKVTRDHTELMLRHFGAEVVVEDLAGGGRRITVGGQPELIGRPVRVPGDISSAAFPMVAALIVPGSTVTLPGVGINPLRAGVVETLIEMGADIRLENRRAEAGEAVADVVVASGPLRGVTVPPERVPSMIDEFPVLAIAAACAEGTMHMSGIAELRVKESDRLAAVARGLAAAGVRVEEGPDSLVVHGTGGRPRGGARVAVELDHRIAMSFLVLGMAAKEPVAIDDAAAIDTSFPGFVDLMNGLGAAICEEMPV